MSHSKSLLLLGLVMSETFATTPSRADEFSESNGDTKDYGNIEWAITPQAGYLFLSETEDLLTPNGFSNSAAWVGANLTHALSDGIHFKAAALIAPLAFGASSIAPLPAAKALVMRFESGIRTPLNSQIDNLFELGALVRFQTMLVTENTFGHGPIVSPMLTLTNTSVLANDYDSEFKIESTVGYAPMKRSLPFFSLTERELRIQVTAHWKVADMPFRLGLEYAGLQFALGDTRAFNLSLYSVGVGYAF